MEDHFLSFPTLFSLMLLLFSILKVVKRFKNSGTTPNLPPGPWKLPIFGSIHHLIGDLPHHRMTELSKKYGPLMHLQLGETSAVVVSCPEIAKEMMKTHGATFAHRPRLLAAESVTYGYTSIAFSPYGDYWRHLRKISTMELLSAKRVRSFHSIREEEVSDLIRDISMNTGSSINLTGRVLSLIYRIVARTAFGDKSKDQEAYTLFIKQIMASNEVFGVTNLFPSQKWLHVISGTANQLKEILRNGDMLLDKLIDAAKTKAGDDGNLLSVLLNLKDHDESEIQLTTNNIKAVIQEVFIGGTETSSTTLDWTFTELMKNPRVLKKAQAEVRKVFGNKGLVDEMALTELKYLKAILKETLRLHTPGPLLLPRECGETCEINGYTIPAGTQVIINAGAIGKDPNYWTEGDKFYPERFLDSPINYTGSDFEFIPFGAGKRICPGYLFATTNIEHLLAQLLYHFDWELPFGTTHENLDMAETFSSVVRRKNDLFVIPISYNPVPVK